MKKVNFSILNPVNHEVTAKIGKTIGGTLSGRFDKLSVSFPEVCARVYSGNIRYSPAFEHALLADSDFIIDHSLVVSLHPDQSSQISSRWTQATTSAPILKRRIVDGPIYIAYNEGSGTWGHWVVHNLPRVLIFLDKVQDGRVILPKSYLGVRYCACLELLVRFGVESDRIVFLGEDEELITSEVWVIDLPYHNGLPHPIVFDQFKSLQHRNLLRTKVDRGAITFIKRENRREIANWTEVERFLNDRSSQIVTKVGTLDEQIEAWSATEAVSGILGSDLTNMVLGNSRRVFVITPSWFGDRFFFGLAAGLGIEWNEMVCDDNQLVERREPMHASSFRVDLSDLEALFSSI